MRNKLSSEFMARILGSGFASRAHSVLWLQDCEDPNPAKAGQHTRRRELRKIQEQKYEGICQRAEKSMSWQAVLSPAFARI